ncbi:TetR-like C-terminal domain-containing protein [Nonomuraea cavernae]|uniref:HTH-type transcriptional regulator n=1 Tax=Nonomuraea cavernae TaxID=2045107 RepID=A0A917YT01_9ACTN|nr:TetR-like C-terminal domain-containing protein [Nonomuraea cavernae]MCA2184508.1 TetR/AcrR family transcriptional regulator [Nonomuraea cavernae]GGO63579.1 putative HTH-type transcriptional regulator [Nonomuraea cavernae]
MSVTPLRGGAAREAELLSAVLEVLRESGYDRLTVDAVAARARAGRQTVYRRWPTKADLVVAAFVNAVSAPPGIPDTGELRGDLLALMESLLDEVIRLGDVFAGLVGETRHNPELAVAMEQHYVATRRRAVLAVFERAWERGELSGSADTDLLWEVGPATLFFRAVASGETVDSELTRRIVDHIVLPLATAGRQPG